MKMVTTLGISVLSLVALITSCGPSLGSGSQEQNLRTRDHDSSLPNLDGEVRSFYSECIISRAHRTPDDISDAQLRCVAPTVGHCEEVLQDQGFLRQKAKEVCASLVTDAIAWLMTEANAIECDSGFCTIVKR